MRKWLDSAKKIAVLSIMTALLIAGKWALNVVPNVEVVTLLCALYGYVFGFVAVIPSTIFCIEETLAWGVHTWVIDYFVHWNVVVIVFALIGKIKHDPMKKSDYVIPVAIAVTLTFLYGVFTSAVDAVFSCIYSEWSRFLEYFGIIYARGIVLFAVHVACNLVLFSFLFNPLAKLMEKLKQKVYT